ncbi:hypothetical protein O181_057066 [Austropuccinia psidii MF-1]|uniref:Uncharacterized protein n=1 Tax=Austropuccinia psidii MF-1 TaxID=1389203 RepID=A0A9Q3E7K4_9BASI|nr:hypothetical protein [Austropuccinia psidii MF-1]
MIGVAEFAGERTIGLLQRIPTNQKMMEIHGTLMRKAQETQKLLGGYKAIRVITEPRKDMGGHPKGHQIEVSDVVYKEMLIMLQKKGVDVRDVDAFPHPLGKWVLSKYANPIQSTKLPNENHNISMMPPNKVVYYKSCGTLKYGKVKAIYSFLSFSNTSVPGILIEPIVNRYARPKYPYSHPGYFCPYGNCCGSN